MLDHFHQVVALTYFNLLETVNEYQTKMLTVCQRKKMKDDRFARRIFP